MPAGGKVSKRKSKPGAKKKKSPSKSKDIANTVEKLITAAGKNITPAEQALYNEVVELARYIQAAREEISTIRPDAVKNEHLPAATDELDAIIGATADATNTIMDAAEIIEGIADTADEKVAGKLVDATTRIYEACGFQDITGQRVSKVVATFKHIEKTIDDLVAAIEGVDSQPTSRPAPKKKKAKPSDEDLLNGPQMGGAAKSQAEIDALMDNFD